MTPEQRAKVRFLEIHGGEKDPPKDSPKRFPDAVYLLSLMAMLFVISGIYVSYNPESWKAFAVGFLIVQISAWSAR